MEINCGFKDEEEIEIKIKFNPLFFPINKLFGYKMHMK